MQNLAITVLWTKWQY